MKILSGKVSSIFLICAFAERATSKVLAFDCLIMPKPIMLTPSPLNSVSSSSAANSTFAISPKRTRYPSSPTATVNAAKSSGDKNVRATRTSKFLSSDSTSPAGSSTFSELITLSTSATVMPRAAIAFLSRNTFMA